MDARYAKVILGDQNALTFRQYGQQLRALAGDGLDVGVTQVGVHEALVRLRVPHYYEEYDGDHMDKVRERLERNVLPFFSTYLVASANPSSPQVKD